MFMAKCTFLAVLSKRDRNKRTIAGLQDVFVVKGRVSILPMEAFLGPTQILGNKSA